MSLNSAFQIGRSALNASQIAIQTTGNNIANAATPGYSRQVVSLLPSADQNRGPFFLGRGVQIGSIRRQVDTALQSRLQSSISQQSLTQSNLELLSTIESYLIGEFTDTDTDVGSQLSIFFNRWSSLASTATEPGARALVVQQGRGLASRLREVRTGLVNQRTQLDSTLATNVARANDLLNRIAGLNVTIVQADNASGNANALRDQRDVLVSELSELVDLTTIDQADGTQDVFVGSTPIVLAGRSRGIRLNTIAVGTGLAVSVTTTDNNEVLGITGGRIGSLLENRATLVDDTISRLDTMTSQLIFQVNRAHSVGYGTTPITSVTGTQSVGSTDFARAFNDPANQTFSQLPFGATNGSFLVTVTNIATGTSEQVRVNVDLDGITAAGTPGFTDDTSLNSLTASLGGIANISASITPDGKLQINAGAGYKINFSDDSSGVLAVLGVNTYFTGSTALDIHVRAELLTTPGLLASGRIDDGEPSDNAAARTIAALADMNLSALGGATLRSYWDEAVSSIGIRTGAAKTGFEAATIVRENLEAQRSAISGVNIDEEAINLITYQRQYAASARFISIIDEMTQTLLSIAR